MLTFSVSGRFCIGASDSAAASAMPCPCPCRLFLALAVLICSSLLLFMRQTSISLSSQLISVCSTCRVTLVPKTSYGDEAFGKEEEYVSLSCVLSEKRRGSHGLADGGSFFLRSVGWLWLLIHYKKTPLCLSSASGCCANATLYHSSPIVRSVLSSPSPAASAHVMSLLHLTLACRAGAADGDSTYNYTSLCWWGSAASRVRRRRGHATQRLSCGTWPVPPMAFFGHAASSQPRCGCGLGAWFRGGCEEKTTEDQGQGRAPFTCSILGPLISVLAAAPRCRPSGTAWLLFFFT